MANQENKQYLGSTLFFRQMGLVDEIFKFLRNDRNRLEAIPKEFIRKKEDAADLPEPVQAYYLESLRKLNELGRTYPAKTEKEICLCKKLAKYDKFEGELDVVHCDNHIVLVIKQPVKLFIKENYSNILEIRKEYIHEKSNDQILCSFQLPENKRTNLQSFLKFIEDGALKYPRLMFVLLKWPLFSIMPKPPKCLLDWCEPQEYEWMIRRQKSLIIADSLFSTPEIQSTTWLIYPKGESWHKKTGIKRFRDLSMDISVLLGYNWIELLSNYCINNIHCGDNEFFNDGWDGLFDDDGDFSEEGFKKGLYNCQYITDVFYESIRLCKELLDSEREGNARATITGQNGSKAGDISEVKLTDTESNILEALDKETLSGPKLLKKAGYDNSSHYRQILSNLIKRKILGRNSNGYYVIKPVACQ